MNVQQQILIMRDKGIGIRRTAKTLDVARNTVRDFLRDYDNQKEESVFEITDTAVTSTSNAIDWAKVHNQFNKGVSIKTQWREICYLQERTYSSFYHEYRRYYLKQPEVTMRLQHHAGEKIFFDFCDGLMITNRLTGTRTKTQLFVGVLPFSGLTKGEFLTDQKQISMFPAVENIFNQIGGVTKYVVFDNLKSAVNKAHIYDPDTNQTMIEFANHWGFAVIPARPYKPRDKAAVEAGIGVIQRQFYQEVREEIFYSIGELNIRFKIFLDELNSAAMKDHGGVSRSDRFENEKQLLRPVQSEKFELSTWKTCKVHPDCHVQVENKFYSVPHRYVGLTVKVRIKNNTVEMFNAEGDALCVHVKIKDTARASTIEAHYPEEKVAASRFEVKHALRQASLVGVKTEEFINKLFSDQYPLKFLRRAQGILRLVQTDTVSKANLEYACTKALLYNRMQFSYVKSAAIFHKSGGGKLSLLAPKRDQAHSYLRNEQLNLE